MFAILKTGGKQYTVAAGDIIRIEKVEGEAGKIIELPQLMLVNDGQSTKVGTPLLSNSLIKATILDQTHNKTVTIFKKRRRQGYDRKNGHRQLMSVVHIDEILVDGKSFAKAQVPAPKPKAKAEPEKLAKKATAKPAAAQTVGVEKSVEQKGAVAKAASPKPDTRKAEEKKIAVKKPATKTAEKPASKKPAAKKTKE